MNNKWTVLLKTDTFIGAKHFYGSITMFRKEEYKIGAEKNEIMRPLSFIEAKKLAIANNFNRYVPDDEVDWVEGDEINRFDNKEQLLKHTIDYVKSELGDDEFCIFEDRGALVETVPILYGPEYVMKGNEYHSPWTVHQPFRVFTDWKNFFNDLGYYP